MSASKQKRRKTLRDGLKYKNIELTVNLLSRQSELEEVLRYFHKLSEKEKIWMDKFIGEWVHAATSKADKTRLIKDTKIVFDRNNARNRCLYTMAKKIGKLSLLKDIPEHTASLLVDSPLDLLLNMEEEQEMRDKLLSLKKSPFKRKMLPK